VTGSRPVPNPFLTAPEVADPGFRAYVLGQSFSGFWKAKERSWRQYGIPADRNLYVDLYVAQDGGRCGICSIRWVLTGKLPAVDHSHDHDNPRVRGLLCTNRCNYDLGVKEAKISSGARVRWTPSERWYLERSEAGRELLSLKRFR